MSERIEEKGKRCVFLCGEPGRFRFIRLNRDASESNRAFEHVARGDLVSITGAERRAEDWRIQQETRVDWVEQEGLITSEAEV